jgi:hypothetical protein
MSAAEPKHAEAVLNMQVVWMINSTEGGLGCNVATEGMLPASMHELAGASEVVCTLKHLLMLTIPYPFQG